MCIWQKVLPFEGGTFFPWGKPPSSHATLQAKQKEKHDTATQRQNDNSETILSFGRFHDSVWAKSLTIL